MRTYTIADGDTLSKIAERECGDHKLWLEIWRMNSVVLCGEQKKRGIRPFERDLIFPGTVLALPEA